MEVGCGSYAKLRNLMPAAFCAWMCSYVVGLVYAGIHRAISVSAGELSSDDVRLEGKGLGIVPMGVRVKTHRFLVGVVAKVAVQLKLRAQKKSSDGLDDRIRSFYMTTLSRRLECGLITGVSLGSIRYTVTIFARP
jgi:hypothetical protein